MCKIPEMDANSKQNRNLLTRSKTTRHETTFYTFLGTTTAVGRLGTKHLSRNQGKHIPGASDLEMWDRVP